MEKVEMLSIILYQVICSSQLIELTLWLTYNRLGELLEQDLKKLYKERESFINKILTKAYYREKNTPKIYKLDYLFKESGISVEEKYVIVYYFLLSNTDKNILDNFCSSFNFSDSSRHLVESLFTFDLALSGKVEINKLEFCVERLVHFKVPSTYSHDIIVSLVKILNKINQEEYKKTISKLAMKYVIVKNISREIPNQSNFEFCCAYLKILLNSGEMTEAFNYQRFVRSKKNSSQMANELLLLVFKYCRETGDNNLKNLRYKQLLQISLNSEEEKKFLEFFKDDKLLLVYYLQGSRFLEASQLHFPGEIRDLSAKFVPPFLSNTNTQNFTKKISNDVSITFPSTFMRPLTLKDPANSFKDVQNLSQMDQSSSFNESSIKINSQEDSFNEKMDASEEKDYDPIENSDHSDQDFNDSPPLSKSKKNQPQSLVIISDSEEDQNKNLQNNFDDIDDFDNDDDEDFDDDDDEEE